MQLPFCKICGERHRLGFCPELDPNAPLHVLLQPQVRPVRQPGLERTSPLADAPIRSSGEHRPAQVSNAPDLGGQPVSGTSGGGAVAPIPPSLEIRDLATASELPTVEGKPKFDKRVYQRELMRKRRAQGLAK